MIYRPILARKDTNARAAKALQTWRGRFDPPEQETKKRKGPRGNPKRKDQPNPRPRKDQKKNLPSFSLILPKVPNTNLDPLDPNQGDDPNQNRARRKKKDPERVLIMEEEMPPLSA
jgi:hypothetical protein